MFSKVEKIIIKNAKNIRFYVVNNDEPRFLKGDRIYFADKREHIKVKKTKNVAEVDFLDYHKSCPSCIDNTVYIDYLSLTDIVFKNYLNVELTNINSLDNIENIEITNMNNLDNLEYPDNDKKFKINKIFKKDLNISVKDFSKVDIDNHLIHNLKIKTNSYSEINFYNGIVYHSDIENYEVSTIENYDGSYFVNVNHMISNESFFYINVISSLNAINSSTHENYPIEEGCFYGNPDVKSKDVHLNKKYFNDDEFLFTYTDKFQRRANVDFVVSNKKRKEYYMIKALKDLMNEHTEDAFLQELSQAHIVEDGFKITWYFNSINLVQATKYNMFDQLNEELEKSFENAISDVDSAQHLNYKDTYDFFVKIDSKLKHSLDNLEFFCKHFKSNQLLGDVSSFEKAFSIYESSYHNFLKGIKETLRIKKDIHDKEQELEQQKLIEKNEKQFLTEIINSDNPTDLITSENRDSFINLLIKYNQSLEELTEKGRHNLSKLMLFFEIKKGAVGF